MDLPGQVNTDAPDPLLAAARERALVESEQRFRGLTEAVPGFVWSCRADGSVDYLNPRYIQFTGLTLEKMTAEGWQHIVHPDDVPAVCRAWETALATGEPFELEFRYKSVADGQYYWFLTRTTPVRDDAGKVVRWVGTSTDISAIKRLEEERARSEELTQHIVEHSPIGILVADTQGRFLHVNDAWLNLLGYTLEDVRSGRINWKEMTVPEHRHLDEQAIDAVRNHGSHPPFEKTLFRKDGSRVPCLAATGYLGGPGEVGVGFLVDLTSVKSAQEQVRESEQRLRFLADSLPDLVWSARPDGFVDYYNRRVLEYFAIPADSPPTGWSWVEYLHADDAARAGAAWTQAVAEGREYECEYRIRRASSGEYRWHVSRGVPMRDATGHIVRWFGTCVDIHDRKLAQAELERAREEADRARREAEHANATKDRFLAVLSHELRTPLTPVVMTIAAMEMEPGLAPQMREDLAMIRRNIELETKLIDDLLDVTRIANGKLRLQPRPTDVHTLLRNVLEILKSEFADKQLNLSFDLAAPDPSVSADPARLQQVFWNLIKNAVKFTAPQGQVVIRTWNPTERTVAVEVTDNGAGIEPAALSRLFNAFDQGEQTITRQFGGLGLGLAISKALTELHGGTITAHSDGKGAGATFRVELPTRLPVERIVDQIQPLRPAADDRHRPRVLLVEDHLDTQRTLRRLLEERGYDVLVAGSVAAAMAVLAESRVDVLVSDIGLPDATGHDLMRQLRSSHGPTLPGIAISGFGMDGDLRASIDAGFTAHLTKPVDLPQLDAMIRSVLAEGAPSPAHPAHAPTPTP